MPILPVFVLSLILAFLVTGLLLWLGRTILFIVPILHGPVFVPSSDDDLTEMLRLADLKSSMKVADFGAGDGKIVIAVAQAGIQVDGFEINPLLVRKARKLIAQLDLTDKATIYRRSFWQVDASQYDVIMLYGTSYIMKKLEKKLRSELKPGAKVVSNFFQFPTWKHNRVLGRVFMYQQK